MIGPYGVFEDILRGTVSIKDILKPLIQPSADEVQQKIREITAKVLYCSSFVLPVNIYRVGQKVSCCIAGCNFVNYAPI